MEILNEILQKNIEELLQTEEKALVELLADRLLYEFKKQDKSGIYGVSQYQLAYHSNRIEGSTLTEKETLSLFETGTIYAASEGVYRSKDIEEMTGHFSMFNEMLKTYNQPLSEELIKKYHFRLKSGVFEDLANGYPVGAYKNRANRVSNIQTANPEDVETQMKKLLEEYRSSRMDNGNALTVLAEFHAAYEKIHPFQDGNGRTGRLILFKEALANGCIPFIIHDENKSIYYHVLNQAQTENDYQGLSRYFAEEQKTFYKEMQKYLFVYSKEKEEIQNFKSR